jgi:hypothetical protein
MGYDGVSASTRAPGDTRPAGARGGSGVRASRGEGRERREERGASSRSQGAAANSTMRGRGESLSFGIFFFFL